MKNNSEQPRQRLVAASLVGVLFVGVGCAVATPRELQSLRQPVYLGAAPVQIEHLGAEFTVSDEKTKKVMIAPSLRNDQPNKVSQSARMITRVASRVDRELAVNGEKACSSQLLEVGSVELESYAGQAILYWTWGRILRIKARLARLRACQVAKEQP